MNAADDRLDDDFVRDVFERMHLPPSPSVAETVESVEIACRPVAAGASPARPRSFAEVANWRRLAWGAGLSATLALVVGLVLLSAGGRLSAMERVAQRLRTVNSYSYLLSTKTTSIDAAGSRTTTWLGEGPTYWSAPDAFRDEMKIVKTDVDHATGNRSVEVLEDFEQVFPAGKRGIFIDHKRKQFFWQAFEPTGSRTYPLEMLKLIRDELLEATRELGAKQVQGKEARGYVVPLTTGTPPRLHEVEVWVDPATELPVEFGYEVSDAEEPRTTTVVRVSDFRWNLDLAGKLTGAEPPMGYHERKPPAD